MFTSIFVKTLGITDDRPKIFFSPNLKTKLFLNKYIRFHTKGEQKRRGVFFILFILKLIKNLSFEFKMQRARDASSLFEFRSFPPRGARVFNSASPSSVRMIDRVHSNSAYRGFTTKSASVAGFGVHISFIFG